jgi:hypothetical protein
MVRRLHAPRLEGVQGPAPAEPSPNFAAVRYDGILQAITSGVDRIIEERDDLARRAAATETKSLRLRQDNLRRAAKSKPQDLARVNTALRELLASVIVDYKSGFLELHWRAGGHIERVLRVPKEIGRPDAQCAPLAACADIHFAAARIISVSSRGPISWTASASSSPPAVGCSE